ncbi:hypothetical protein [Falsiroseomonas sp. E2-1-a20]|uniref:hypothetical protein n=1 Tax=Falsiroseomonas sp. E2-1-a20 TaxID=3239300 RepID=UPI003F2E4453
MSKPVEIVKKLRSIGVGRVIIYGLKRNNHTHHFIHSAFFNAFSQICANTDISVEWVEDHEGSLPEPEGALILAYCLSGWHDTHLPLSENAFYLVHGTSKNHVTRYFDLAKARRVLFFDEHRGDPRLPKVAEQNVVATHWYTDRPGVAAASFSSIENPNGATWEYASDALRTVVTTWGTDLLPDQVKAQSAKLEAVLEARRSNRMAVFVGSVWTRNIGEMALFSDAAKLAGLSAHIVGGWIDAEFAQRFGASAKIETRSVTDDENRDLVAGSLLAPAIQGAGQLNSYVPCRIFKNISYGAFGLTNNPLVRDIMPAHVKYHPDIAGLLKVAVGEELSFNISRLREAMDFVAEHHTYLNRIDLLLGRFRSWS